MLKMGDIMTPNPQVVNPRQTVKEANRLMETGKFGGLPVVEDGRLVGIITSRDLRLSHPNRLVVDVMTRKVVTVHPETTLWKAQQMLEEHGIERLVVVDDHRRVIGIATKSVVLGEFWRHWDALTSLPKSSVLHRKGEEMLNRGCEISLIFLDLNDFGRIDKEHGHVFGDAVLQVAASVFCSQIETPRDFLCRYGGDEFAIISTRRLREAVLLADRLVFSLTKYKWPPGIFVTCSAGVAGGRRKRSRSEQSALVISQLLNLASLASSRAKKDRKPVAVASRMECAAAYG